MSKTYSRKEVEQQLRLCDTAISEMPEYSDIWYEWHEARAAWAQVWRLTTPLHAVK